MVKRPDDKIDKVTGESVSGTASTDPHDRGRFPVRRLIPNAVTLLALSLGLTAMRLGLDGRYELAMLCIVLAGMLDAIDGRLARLLRAESPLGAQLDSLTDFINFGVAPVFLVYLWALQATGRFGWAVILFFSICCALRLARFNVAMEEPDRPAWKMRFFTGVPSPAAGGLVMLPMFLQAADLRMTENDVPLVLVNITVVALLMVSRIPTISGKGLSPTIRRDMVLPIMLLVGAVAVLIFTFPWVALSLVCLIYYLLLPYGWFSYRRLAARRSPVDAH